MQFPHVVLSAYKQKCDTATQMQIYLSEFGQFFRNFIDVDAEARTSGVKW